MFKITKKSTKSRARAGVLTTRRGRIKTPFFMPVATQGAVKMLSTEDMRLLGAQILLSNTYHLMLRPGEKYIKKIGGLHKFIGWEKPILTDSGGFQIFSLSAGKNKSGQSLVEIGREGVSFKSYINGAKYSLTPEKSFDIQNDLGVDIAVCLDECVALPARREYVEKSIELTAYWAAKTKKHYQKKRGSRPLLFAVVQGGLDKELRLRSLNELSEIGFDGYNIGGLSVGESPEEMYGVLDYLVPEMPEDKTRYLMGVGYPDNIVEAVKRGVDMFDCVIPTREGRHGRLFYFTKNIELIKLSGDSFFKTRNMLRSRFQSDHSPINKKSKIKELRTYTLSYLHYLFKIKEPLGQRLATLNNLEFYLELMQTIRKRISRGGL